MQSSSFYMHFDPETVFFAAGIRGFSDETRAKYRSYIQDEKHRTALYEIMKLFEAKRYRLPEPKYKRLPREFDKDMRYPELAKYGSMYVYKEIPHLQQFFTADLCDFAYNLYEEMLPMQEWVYEMTLS